MSTQDLNVADDDNDEQDKLSRNESDAYDSNNQESPPPKLNEIEIEEAKFKEKVKEIITNLHELPSDTPDMTLYPPSKNIPDVYSNLCERLQILPDSTFLYNLKTGKMDFSFHNLGITGLIPIAKALIPCTSVKDLNFSHNNLGLISLPAINYLIEQNSWITRLNLASNALGKGSGKELHELVLNCNYVVFLDLSCNELGDEELFDIGSALAKNDHIKELNLANNDFGASTGPAFGSFLSKCGSLEKLDLSCNHFEEGAAGIFNGMKNNSNLKILDLSRNGITDSAMHSLAPAIRANKGLQVFDLSCNCISTDGIVALSGGLKGNTVLESFNLSKNPFCGTAAGILLNSVGNNLKKLDISGIRVDTLFLKTLRTFMKSGRDLIVSYGAEVRRDSIPRSYYLAKAEASKETHPLLYIETLAEERGLSLSEVFQSIQATYLHAIHEAELVQAEEAKGDKKGKGEAPKGKGEAPKGKDHAKHEPEEKIEPPKMKAEDLAKLMTGALAIPYQTALELSKHFEDKDGVINFWEITESLRSRSDDIEIKNPIVEEPPPVADKKKK